MGLYNIKSEFEDLYLKHTDPKSYDEIAQKLQITKTDRQRFIKNFITPLEEIFEKQNIKFTIKGRPKSIFSIWNKIQKEHTPFDEIYDLFAIRIILDIPVEQEKEICWKAYSMVTDCYKPNPSRLRDWVSVPKSNGYESLHTTVMGNSGSLVEVQIRTKRMDEVAEKGYAAHWKYKEGNTTEKKTSLDDWIGKIRKMLEQNQTSSKEILDDFQANLYSDEVFVFTPTGELKTLPIGSTVLDFAFEVHSDLGTKCTGAKVNKKFVAINYVLQNGEQIDILTAHKQKPNNDWLHFLVSPKARNQVKEYLKRDQKGTIKQGKEMLMHKLKQCHLELDNETTARLKLFFNEKTISTIYYKIGQGAIGLKGLKNENLKNIPQQIKHSKNEAKRDFDKATIKINRTAQHAVFIGEAMHEVEYTFARCCKPTPNNDIFGFITANNGVKIHKKDCKHAEKLFTQYGYRIVTAHWEYQTKNFLVGIIIEGSDRIGMTNDVTEIISNTHQVNMQAINFSNQLGIFKGKVTFFVDEIKKLNFIIKKVKNIESVNHVKRFNPVLDSDKR